MQREVINGIPFLCDKAGKLYVYEPTSAAQPGSGSLQPGSQQPSTTPLQIGTKTADGFQLLDGWEQRFQERLTSWRNDIKPHSRKPVAASSKNTTATSSR